MPSTVNSLSKFLCQRHATLLNQAELRQLARSHSARGAAVAPVQAGLSAGSATGSAQGLPATCRAAVTAGLPSRRRSVGQVAR